MRQHLQQEANVIFTEIGIVIFLAECGWIIMTQVTAKYRTIFCRIICFVCSRCCRRETSVQTYNFFRIESFAKNIFFCWHITILITHRLIFTCGDVELRSIWYISKHEIKCFNAHCVIPVATITLSVLLHVVLLQESFWQYIQAVRDYTITTQTIFFCNI